jgi:hypothetical protein
MTNDENKSRAILNENAVVRNNEKKARKEGVTKGVWITAIISFVLLSTAGIMFHSMYTNEQKKQLSVMENQKHSFTEQLTSRDSVINEWMLTFDQIEKDLNMVKEKENLITLKSSDMEFSKDKKQQILKDIENINTVLDANKKKIASLTAQLKNSGGAIKGLQVKVAELEATMKLRENEVAELKTALVEKNFQIEQLNTRMTEQEKTIAQRDEKIGNQTTEMNKGYLTSGTYKALKLRGLVNKEGGFLGLGKKESLQGNFADSSFTRVDITVTKTIPVNSKSAKLITKHPSSSYELVRGKDNKIDYIAIKDPEQFWKISKYAVVETKN